MAVPQQPRRLTDGMRRLLFVASGLVALAAFQLFVLTDHTQAYFSWTIQPGMTAAFLGAGYLASVFLEYLAARRAVWVEVRHTIPPVLSFTILTEIVTLLHLGKFHFGERLVWAGLAAWVWLAIYTLVPITMIVLLPGQLRVRGTDPPRTAPIPRAAVVAMGVHAAVALPVGALLFIDPVRWSSIWPWELTPLTGRAVAAWLLGIGVGLVAVMTERDLRRSRPGLIAYAVFGAGQLVALARYGRDVRWGEPQAWVLLVWVTSAAVLGMLGIVASSRAATEVGTR
ncbi:MAG TPA: hypothetical protein VGR41_06700 [Actinomycetota bacterium]|jgi:hypothetical protein|nr:hypothetical protein [Actinomycetota bacterium]